MFVACFIICMLREMLCLDDGMEHVEGMGEMCRGYQILET
jgi:hypothetical protein